MGGHNGTGTAVLHAVADTVTIGARVRFGPAPARWWTVRDRDDRYVIATRRVPFLPGAEQYTVIDLACAVRSGLNTPGGAWHPRPTGAQGTAWWDGILAAVAAGRCTLSAARAVPVTRLTVR